MCEGAKKIPLCLHAQANFIMDHRGCGLRRGLPRSSVVEINHVMCTTPEKMAAETRWRQLLTAHLLLRGAYLSMAKARDPIDYISRPRRGVVPPIPTWTLKVTENRTEAAA